jgi:hypothetical protein
MKMMVLTLESLGVSVQEVCTGFNTESKIIHDWKKRYGKMFYKCKVEVIDDGISAQSRFSKVKKIHNLKTGETYNSYKECMEETGLNHHHIYAQCAKRMQTGYHYWLKYA